jgi:hypothetical protein
LRLDAGNILQSPDSDLLITTLKTNGDVSSSLELSPNDDLTRLERWSSQTGASWTTADWATGVYTIDGGLGAVVFTGAATIINFVNSLNGVGQIYFSVNGGPQLLWDGSSGDATNITFYTPTLPATDPTTVTSFEYFYSYKSGFQIDYDSNEVNVYANDADIYLQTTNLKDIGIYSSRNLSLLGNGGVTITNNDTASGINIVTDASDSGYQWSFGVDGSTTFPNGAKLNPGTAGQFATDNTVTTSLDLRDTTGAGFYTNGSGYTLRADGIQNWIFGTDGNLTLPSNGFLVVSGGIVGGGASPAPYLSDFSSISTVGATGNITASGYFIGDGGYLSNIAGANVVGEVALANTVSNPAQPNITSVGVLTSLTTNSLNVEGQFTANGNAQFNQDVYFAGNVTLPGNINQISGNSGQFFGNAVTGFGAIYVGLPAGYTLLNNEVAQFADNFNGYTQVTHQNINGGDQATGDFVITADNGTDLVNHIDLGMAGSGYDGTLANNSLGTILYPNDGYLYTRGNVTGGNLVLGSNQANGVVRIFANGASNIGNTIATFAANGLTVAANITSSANISGNYIKGNGSQLTGMYGNTQVAAYLPVNTSNVAGNNFTVSGNVTAGSLGSQEQLLGYTATATTVIFDLMGNFPQTFNAGQTIYVSGILTGPTNLNGYWPVTAANLTTVTISCNLQPTDPLVDIVYGQVANIRNITATGNITGGYLIGDGGQITNITGANVSGTVANAAYATAAGAAGSNTQLQFNNAGNLGASANLVFTDTVGGGTVSVGDNLSLLGNGTVTTPIGNLYLQPANALVVTAGSSDWVFDVTGNLTVPGTSGGLIKTVANGAIGIAAFDNGSDNPAQLMSFNSGSGAPTTIISAYSTNATIQSNVTGAINTWAFDNTGNLTLPGNTFSVNYANGTQVSLGGSYSNADVSAYLASGDNGADIITTANVSASTLTTVGAAGTGNIVGVNYITANYLIGDGSMITNLPTNAPVIETVTSGATITPAALDTQYNVTALAESATFAAPSGTPLDGQKLTIRILDNGTAQTLAWNAIYQVIGTTLPTTTVANKYTYVGCIYNSQSSKWDVVSVAQQA